MLKFRDADAKQVSNAGTLGTESYSHSNQWLISLGPGGSNLGYGTPVGKRGTPFHVATPTRLITPSCKKANLRSDNNHARWAWEWLAFVGMV